MDAALDMNTHKINNVVDPAAAQDAATKAYVDAAGGSGFWTDEGSYLKATEAEIRLYSGASNTRIYQSGTAGYIAASSGDLYIDAADDLMLDAVDDIVLMTNSVEFLRCDFGDNKVEISKELNMQTHKINNVVDPTAAQDAATKAYVDGIKYWTDEGTYLKATEADIRVYNGANYLKLNHDGTEGYLSVNSGSLYLDAPNDIMLDSGDDIVLMTNSFEFLRCNLGTDKVELSKALKVVAYTLPTTDGTNTQALQTNGSGTVSWGSILTNPMGADLNMNTHAIINLTTLTATKVQSGAILTATNTYNNNALSWGVYGEGVAIGVYAKLTGTTSVSGAIYGYSSSVTSGNLMKLRQTTSTFTGNMIYGDMASTFSGHFADFRKNNVSMFSIDSNGDVEAGEFLAWDSAGNKNLRIRQTNLNAFITNTEGDIRMTGEQDIQIISAAGKDSWVWVDAGDEIYLTTNIWGSPDGNFNFLANGDFDVLDGDVWANDFNVNSPKDFKDNAIEAINKSSFNDKKTFPNYIKKLPTENKMQKRFNKQLMKLKKKMEDKKIEQEEIDRIVQEEEKGREDYIKKEMKCIGLGLGEMIAVLWKGMKEMDTRMSTLESKLN